MPDCERKLLNLHWLILTGVMRKKLFYTTGSIKFGMTKKGYLSLFLLSLFLYPFFYCQGQDSGSKQVVSDSMTSHPARPVLYSGLSYEHTLVHGSTGAAGLLVGYSPAGWTDLSGGVSVSSANLYRVAVRGDFKWNFHTHHYFGISNRYLYSVYAGDNLQNFNAALALFYNQDYFHFAIGGCLQLFAGITSGNSSAGGYLCEPGIVYDIEARIFRSEHIWNIGLQITNMRRFLIERMYNPNFVLKGNYRFGGYGSDNLNLIVEAGFQPAGIMHIAANYYSFFFNVGISCVI